MPHSRIRLNTSTAAYGRLLGHCLLGIEPKGDPTARLAESLSARSGAAHALVANQNRVGIYAAVRAATRGERKQVILSPYTLYEVVNIVVYAGAEPVFVDTMPHTPFVSVEDVGALANDKTAAILLTHYHLPCPDTEAIAELARSKNIRLIEDAAVSYGGKLNGKWVGRFGDAGIFSFGLVKVLNAFYGGAVISDNEEFFEAITQELAGFTRERRGRLFKRAVYGLALDTMMYPPIFSAVFPFIRYGFRSKNDFVTRFTRADARPSIRSSYPDELQRTPTKVQSRLVLDQLEGETRAHRTREERARRLIEAFGDIDDIVLPDFPDNAVGSWTEFPIVVGDRNALYGHLLDRGRDIRYYYYRNCAELSIFERYGGGDCPNARALMHSTLMLPLYPRYPEGDFQANIDAIRAFYKKSSGP